MGKLTIPFKVACILMHRNVNYPAENPKYFVISFDAFLELKVLIPEWMSQEVEADTIGTSFEEPTEIWSIIRVENGGIRWKG